jgi:hypothetical protein
MQTALNFIRTASPIQTTFGGSPNVRDKFDKFILTRLKFKPIYKGDVFSRGLSLTSRLAPHYEGVLGEWKYNSTHSLTSAIDGGGW